MASPQQPKGLFADPEGDVRFVFGDSGNENGLRVSSKVLSIASPVLKALFSPKYAEGAALCGSQDVLEILLPDDDPEAMTLMCHVLHHGNHTPEKLSVELLEKTATLCDKYDVVRAFTAWSDFWLRAWIADACGQDIWIRIMQASHMLDNHGVFFLASSNLVLSCSSPAVNLVASAIGEGSGLSQRIIGESCCSIGLLRQLLVLNNGSCPPRPASNYLSRLDRSDGRALKSTPFSTRKHKTNCGSPWPQTINQRWPLAFV